MAKPLLALCSIPQVAMRDGYTGQFAKIMLPFYEFGYWFASGQQPTFPGGTIGQVHGMQALLGTTKPNTFQKTAGVCLG